MHFRQKELCTLAGLNVPGLIATTAILTTPFITEILEMELMSTCLISLALHPLEAVILEPSRVNGCFDMISFDGDCDFANDRSHT